MWNYVYRQYGNYNPAGIVINPGYYALAECIVKGTFAGDSLLRWCGVGYDAYEPKKDMVKIHTDKLDSELKKRYMTPAYLSRAIGKSAGYLWGMLKRGQHRCPRSLVYLMEEELNLEKGSLIKEETK